MIPKGKLYGFGEVCLVSPSNCCVISTTIMNLTIIHSQQKNKKIISGKDVFAPVYASLTHLKSQNSSKSFILCSTFAAKRTKRVLSLHSEQRTRIYAVMKPKCFVSALHHVHPAYFGPLMISSRGFQLLRRRRHCHGAADVYRLEISS